MKKFLLLGLSITLLLTSSNIYAEVLFSLDFTKEKSGNAVQWLEENGFDFKLDADDLSLSFDRGLILRNEGDINGLMIKQLNIKNAKRVKIEWGVQKFPAGIDWENGIFRDTAMVIVSFGTQKISSGSFVVPNLPYFLGIFLGQKEIEGKAYKGNYYQKGGRYFCSPCPANSNQTVVTNFELSDRFKSEFGRSTVPPITAIAIESDTRDLEGIAETHIKRIEFLSD